MRRIGTLLMAVGVILALSAVAAVAGGKSWDDSPTPPHGHVMLIGVQVDGGSVTFKKCVEVGAGKALPVSAHHDSIHTGTPGGSPFVGGPLFRAGNWVVPLAPLTPYTGCGDFSSPFSLGGD